MTNDSANAVPRGTGWRIAHIEAARLGSDITES
jgi:hypothetical protein